MARLWTQADGEWIRSGKIMVHSTMGWIINAETEKPLKVYRNLVTGRLGVILPVGHGVEGIGSPRTRYTDIKKVILLVLQGGSPLGDQFREMVISLDGYKWNIRPDNLQWITQAEHAYRRVMDNNVPLKLNGHIAITLRDVVSRMGIEGIKDYDAIGSIFRVSGTWVNRVVTRKAWYYVEEFIDSTTVKAADYQLEKAREAAMLYADRDADLNKYMASAIRD